MAKEDKQTLTGAEEIHWDLSSLYTGLDDPQLRLDMENASNMATTLADEYRGRIADLDAAELARVVQRADAIVSLLVKVDGFVELTWSTDTQNPELGQWMAKKNEHANEVRQQMLFFEVEWVNAPEAVGELADDPALRQFRHFLKTERLRRPHTLSEPEEKIISQLSLSGIQGWGRFYDEIVSQLTFDIDGQEYTFGEISSFFNRPDRELRRKSAAEVTRVLEQNRHPLTFIFNMMLLEKASIDKLRGYATWISERNLGNQVDDDTVEALITAVTSRYDIVARYYHLLKRQLGYETLYDYDRYAPVAAVEINLPWVEARSLVLDAFASFDQRFSDIARLFFERRWIDAPPQKGKMSGAFCALMGPTVNPFVFLNYMGTMNDVMTLAHELGHGLHAWLSREQRQLQFWPPITTTEMASTFGEMLVFDHLVQQQPDPQVRFAMRMEKMAGTIATVFRQIALNRFEEAIHTGRREQGELTSKQMSDMWMEAQKALYGDSLTMREEYRLWWSYIGHFITTPGYVYGYAFGELLVWALYALYRNNPNGFADRYLEVLRAGGSDWPHHVLAPMGVDLQDPNFWHEGLNLMDSFVSDMERDATQLE